MEEGNGEGGGRYLKPGEESLVQRKLFDVLECGL